MATVSDLNVVAQAFLTASMEALALTDAGAPGRSYVSPGEPALDCCGQCVVYVQTLDDAQMNAGAGALAQAKALNRGTQPRVTLFVQATRCVDTTPETSTGLPDPLKLEDAAIAINQDGWALRNHLLYELRHGELAQLCSGAEFLGGNVIVPQGGCVGWTFSFRYPGDGGVLS